MRNNRVSVSVKHMYARQGGKLEDTCSIDTAEAEIAFILNRNSNPSLSMVINGKDCYVLDAEIAGKILELIHTP